jgi:hypothetical protein
MNQRLRRRMPLRDMPDLVTDVVDRDFESIQPSFDPVKPEVDRPEPAVIRVEPLTGGSKAGIDLLLEPIQTIVDRVRIRHGPSLPSGATTIASSAGSFHGNDHAAPNHSGL